MKGCLEAALKPRSDRNSSQRTAALKAALDQAEELLEAELGPDATELILPPSNGPAAARKEEELVHDGPSTPRISDAAARLSETVPLPKEGPEVAVVMVGFLTSPWLNSVGFWDCA